MKRCLMILGVLITLIIPISSVKALFTTELKDGTELVFTDLPVSDDEEYVILKNSNNQYYLFSYTSVNRYFSLRYGSNTHFELEFTAISGLTDTYKMYVYDGINWIDRTSNSRYNGSCSGSCYWQYSSSLAYGTINADKRFVQVVYSTNDLIFNSNSSTNYTFISTSNFDVSTWSAGDIVYYKNENNIPIEYISYDYELINHNKTYGISIYTENYVDSYTYKYKFDYEENFTDITSDLANSITHSYDCFLNQNATLYLVVYDENNDLVYSETYTFTGLNIFYELIDVSLYDEIIITFDNNAIDDLISNDEHNVWLDYDIYYSDSNLNLLDNYFLMPEYSYYGCTSYSGGSMTCGNKHRNIPKGSSPNSVSFNDAFYLLSEYRSDLKIIINTEDLEDNYLRIYLKSQVPFTIEYVSKNTNSQYYSTVDLTGKYAGIFIPKHNGLTYTPIFRFTEGKYFIQVRDNYSEEQDDYTILRYYQLGFCDYLYKGDEYMYDDLPSVQCVNNYIRKLSAETSYYDETKSFIYVKNENYNNSKINSVVTYDTRYFDVYIQENIDSILEIYHPLADVTDNFGPIINMSEKYISDSDSNYLNIFSTAFNRFKSVIKEIFQNITYFFNNSSDILKDFYIVIATLIFLIFLIRFIL